MIKRVQVFIDDVDDRFLKWMAKKDQVTYHMEMDMIFSTELKRLEQLHFPEFLEEMSKEEQK